MNSLADLADLLNDSPRDRRIALSARDVDRITRGEHTPLTVWAALQPHLRGDDLYEFTAAWDERMIEIWSVAVMAQPAMPQDAAFQRKVAAWEAHMARFVAAHRGHPQDPILIELERRSHWDVCMGPLADVIDPPELPQHAA